MGLRAAAWCGWVAAAFAALLIAAPGAHAQRRMALVIGNADYNGDGAITPAAVPPQGGQYDLRNPINDARAVASMLGASYGNPQPITDANFLEMSDALSAFAVEVERADREADRHGEKRPIVLIYFAGHGIEISGVNFLIPVEARLPPAEQMQDISGDIATTRLAGRAMAVEDVSAMFDSRGSGVTIVIVDACRNNPYGRSVRGASRGDEDGLAGMGNLIPADDQGSVFIATSASARNVADDGSGDNSPFARAFVQFGARSDLSFSDAFTEITGWVIANTPNRQRPWLYGSATGRFCLLECAVGQQQAVVVTPPVAPPVDLALRARAQTFCGGLREAANAVLDGRRPGFQMQAGQTFWQGAVSGYRVRLGDVIGRGRYTYDAESEPAYALTFFFPGVSRAELDEALDLCPSLTPPVSGGPNEILRFTRASRAGAISMHTRHTPRELNEATRAIESGASIDLEREN